jgi:biotin-(acetyl-CoA carboxylase) ligase
MIRRFRPPCIGTEPRSPPSSLSSAAYAERVTPPYPLNVLSDSPAAVVALTGTQPQRREGASLPSDVARAWEALVGGDAWQAGAGERWVIIRDQAPASQFDALAALLASGVTLPDRLATLAATGARFRGQRGRPWVALRGNLHLCSLHALDLPAAAHQVGLSIWPAVATARAIERVTSGAVKPATKWVNDLLLDDRKVAGVLAQSGVQRGRIRHALLGIGLNVAQAPTATGGLAATALAAYDDAFTESNACLRIVAPLLAELDAARAALERGDAASLWAAYRERAGFIGRQVSIWPDEIGVGTPRRGRVEALHDDLGLELSDGGDIVRSGRMILEPETAGA